jgi:pimeloyl-ACP methyl ester carboxylesterase
MEHIAGFPNFEVQFTKAGSVNNPDKVLELETFLDSKAATDLFVISHGWNNDMDEARKLYDNFFDHIRTVLDAGKVPELANRRFAVLSLLWPSKKFAEKSLIPGGAASAESAANDILRAHIDDLKGTFDDPAADIKLEQAKQLIDQLEDKPKARDKFVELLRSVLPRENETDVDASDKFFNVTGEDLMDAMKQPVKPRRTADIDSGGAARADEAEDGDAAGLIDFLGGFKTAALNVLNYATYYQMKERAGLIGRDSVNPMVKEIRALVPELKIHLIGHSFGGRLVTATAAGREDNKTTVDTMTLLQAAFSHQGFADHIDGTRTGFFRRVISRKLVAGPLLITCTINDNAVGKMYPLASLLAGQDAAGLFDKNSRFGGIGCHGAQLTPEATDGELLPVGGSYRFDRGKLYNLKSDDFIKGHSDICNDQVAYALLKGVAAT